MDPIGANAGIIKPITWPEPTSSGKLEPYYGVSELNSAYDGCEVNGVPMDCNEAAHVEKTGAGKVTVPNPVDPSKGGRRRLEWARRDTSYATTDLEANTVTIYSGSGGEFVWMEEPGAGLETFVQNRQLQKPVTASELKRIRTDVEKAITAKLCADFLKALLDRAAVLTGQPYRDIMVTFDNINFTYGDTGAYGGFASGSFEGETAAAVIVPFEGNFISADRSAFIRTQTAQNFLGETLHHVGTGSAYTDGFLANALNAILVSQGKDSEKTFSDRTKADVQVASMYWHSWQFEVCKIRYQ